MSERMTPARLAEIREFVESRGAVKAPRTANRCMIDLLAELDAVTRERDTIHSALGVIGVKDADLVGTIANLTRERDTAVESAVDLLDRLRTAQRERDDERKRLEAIIERERTWSVTWINRVQAEIRMRRLISQSRGPYEWDDDGYMEEFGAALDAIESALQKATRDTNCTDLSDCPTTGADVAAALDQPSSTPAALGGDHA